MNPSPDPLAQNAPHAPGAPWPIDEAAAHLRISERHLRRLLDANKVKSLRLGRRRLIPDAEIQRLANKGC